jgi:hypothetical protein
VGPVYRRTGQDTLTGRAPVGRPNGVFKPNKDAEHEKGESAQREAEEDAGRGPWGQAPGAADIIDRINPELLRAMATAPDMYFQTVDTSDLARIYAEIAHRLGCPPTSFWGRR